MSREELLPVAIVGGGPVGMALALALHKQDIAAEIFDERERGAGLKDRRTLALSHGSRQTLEWLGAWQGIDATPIHRVHISHCNHAGRTVIRAEDEGVPALGHVASLHEIYKALDKAVAKAGIAYHEHTRISSVHAEAQQASFIAGSAPGMAKLVAYAEGAIDTNKMDPEEINTHDYGQHAVTAIVTSNDAPANAAWERFTPHGPIALLPFGQAFAVVQSCSPEDVARLTAMSAAEYLAQLQSHFADRMHFVGAGPRYTFPLGLRYRRSAIDARQVWLGNAAQTLHPVAGQGFNLALRDARALTRVIVDAVDPGSADVLAAYAANRRVDRRSTIGFTDMLVRLFSNNNPVAGHFRGAGLLGLDVLPPVRSFIARRMMFGARAFF